MKLLPKRVASIRATWILPMSDEVYFYREQQGTILYLPEGITFELRCTHGDDQDFSATLQEEEGKIRLRFSGEDGTEDLFMRKTESPNEIILCHESLKQVIYLHLSTG